MESDSSAICSDSSVGKLRELLKLESKSHRDTGRCYDTLQQEYDELLRKYAEAENTIDRLRIDLLRDRFANKDAANDTTEIAVSNVNAWQRLYDDLLGRTTKLQNNVHAFQEYLVNQEAVGEEMNVIFDRLHTDFGNISNAFHSMQSLGHKVVIPEEKETSIAADDLEGNLNRLGLRLDEIREEYDKKLRNTLNTNGDNLAGRNHIPRFTTGKFDNSNKSYEAECSETETIKGELNFDSDTDSELHLDCRRPVTDDLSEMVSYRRQMDDNFGVVESKNLYRSFSEPRSLHNLENSVGDINTDFTNELNSDEDCAFADFDANDLGSHTVVFNKLDMQNTSAKDLSSLKPSHQGTITSLEDSGYQGSSHTLRRGFGSRIPKLGSKKDGNLALNLSQIHGPIMEEDIIEEYRKRLDSLRDYILAKRAANDSSYLPAIENIDGRPKNASRKKKTIRNSTRSSPISKENNRKPSASQSDLSYLTQNTAEKTRNLRRLVKDAKDIAKSNDIETLKNEMHDVRAIILAIKDSLNVSSGRSPNDLDFNENEKSPTSICNDEINSFGEHKVEDLELAQLHSLQNKQFEILKQLESKIDEIPRKMHSILQNQERKNSRRYQDGMTSPSRPRNRPRGRLSNSQLTNRSSKHVISDNAKGSPPVTPNYTNGSPHKIPDGIEKSPRISPDHTLKMQDPSPSITRKSPRNSQVSSKSPNDITTNQRYRNSNKNGDTSNDCVDGKNISMKSNDNAFQDRSFSGKTGSISSKDSVGSSSSQKIERLDNNESRNTTTIFSQREKESEIGPRKFDELGEKMTNLLSYLMKYKESESNVSEGYAASSHVLLKKFDDKLEALAKMVDIYEKKAQNISDGRCLSDHLKEGVGVGAINPWRQGIDGKYSCTLTKPVKTTDTSGTSKINDQFQNNFAYHGNDESSEKFPSSPNIYHHYHTFHSPSEDQANRPIMQNSSTEFRTADVHGEIIEPTLQSYLEKATLTAVQVEYLSKKMLQTMANDFLYTGPTEF